MWRDDNMTRIKKIQALIEKGEEIKYHYNYYTNQRRLIVDKVNDIKYNNTSEDQGLANSLIDIMYWEYTN